MKLPVFFRLENARSAGEGQWVGPLAIITNQADPTHWRAIGRQGIVITPGELFNSTQGGQHSASFDKVSLLEPNYILQKDLNEWTVLPGGVLQ